MTYLIKTDRMMKTWRASVYAFFEVRPEIEYREVKGVRQKCHVFKCSGRGCTLTRGIARYLNTKDSQSTSNLRSHIKNCKGWGEDVLKLADQARDVDEARSKITKNWKRSRTLTAVFERNNKSKVTYSTRSHTKPETRYAFMFHINMYHC